MNNHPHACDHQRGRLRNLSSAVTVCHHCRDFLCSICGVTIDWHEGLCVANPGVQWRFCTKDTCVTTEAAYHVLPVDEMIRCRDALRNKRVSAHLRDRGIEPPPPPPFPSDTLVTHTTAGGAQRIFLTPRAFVLDPGEACWCNLGKDCAGSHQIFVAEPQNLCGLCGQEFRIANDDPHWSTGRGPLCPTIH